MNILKTDRIVDGIDLAGLPSSDGVNFLQIHYAIDLQ